MVTKLRAARLAARSGAATVIVGGRESQVLPRVVAGELLGTFLIPDTDPLTARKRWLAGQLKLKGTLGLDEGAVRVLQESGRSLLPVGVVSVGGEFERGDLVACLDPKGLEVARGLVNYNADETRLIMRHPSSMIEALIGYVDEPELIHRDNLVLVG
jgi:glutamate 5-kinase